MCDNELTCEENSVKSVTKSDNRESGAFLSATNVHNIQGVNKLCATICNQQVAVLIDTGSTINAISTSLCKKLSATIKPLCDIDYSFCTLANGATANFSGKIETDIHNDQAQVIDDDQTAPGRF